MARSFGPNGFAKEPERASNCASFASSFGLSENIDGSKEANKTSEIGRHDRREKDPCKPFSKVLIVRAILRLHPGNSIYRPLTLSFSADFRHEEEGAFMKMCSDFSLYRK